MKPHYFVSDLHLGARGDAERRQRFYSFLDTIQNHAASLFIVGDLFEFGFEFRGRLLGRNVEIAERLRQLALAGVRVALIPGNHDCWLGEAFHRQYRVEVLDSPTTLELEGKRLYLSHGDELDSSFSTRVTRALFRSRSATRAYSWLPEWLGARLAVLVAGASRARGKKPWLVERLGQFAEAKLQSGCDLVVLAHVHVEQLSEFAAGQYLNPGDWLTLFSYGVLEDGKLRLEHFARRGHDPNRFGLGSCPLTMSPR